LTSHTPGGVDKKSGELTSILKDLYLAICGKGHINEFKFTRGRCVDCLKMVGIVKRRGIKYYGLFVKGDNNMRTKNVLTIVLAATVLIVASAGNACAYTWNSQTDVTQLTSSSTVLWYDWISSTGSAQLNNPVTWQNGLNHAAYGVGAVKPAPDWSENMKSSGWANYYDQYYSTLNYGQAWGIIEQTHDKVQSNSQTYITVSPEYFDSTGTQLMAVATQKTHSYTIN
jgi:hypothetical protein